MVPTCHSGHRHPGDENRSRCDQITRTLALLSRGGAPRRRVSPIRHELALFQAATSHPLDPDPPLEHVTLSLALLLQEWLDPLTRSRNHRLLRSRLRLAGEPGPAVERTPRPDQVGDALEQMLRNRGHRWRPISIDDCHPVTVGARGFQFSLPVELDHLVFGHPLAATV